MEIVSIVELSDEELKVLDAMKKYPSLYLHPDQIRVILYEDFDFSCFTNWIRVRLVSMRDKGLVDRIGK